jgi:WD40 repeat protein
VSDLGRLKDMSGGWRVSSSRFVPSFFFIGRYAYAGLKDDLIISGSNDCKIKVWSASTGECIRTLVGHEMLVRALSFEPRSGRLVSASYDRCVKVWDLKSGEFLCLYFLCGLRCLLHE